MAVIEPRETLRVGDTIRIAGKANVDFTQKIESMELNHQKIEEAKPGDAIGLKVDQKVSEGCCILKP